VFVVLEFPEAEAVVTSPADCQKRLPAVSYLYFPKQVVVESEFELAGFRLGLRIKQFQQQLSDHGRL